MSRTTPAGAWYNAGSLSYFAPTAHSTVWPPPPSAANLLRHQIAELLRRDANSEDGVSLRAIDAVVRDFSIIDINKELARMSDDGKLDSYTCSTAYAASVFVPAASSCYKTPLCCCAILFCSVHNFCSSAGLIYSAKDAEHFKLCS